MLTLRSFQKFVGIFIGRSYKLARITQTLEAESGKPILRRSAAILRMHGKGGFRPSPGILTLASFALVGLIIWGAQSILIPLTLALLLSFIGGRFLRFLEKHRVPHSGAVTLLSVTVVSIFVLGTWLIGAQVIQVSEQLPTYRDNLSLKIESVEGGLRTFVNRFRISPPGKRSLEVNDTARVVTTKTSPQIAPTNTSAPLLNGVQDFAPPLFHFLGISAFVIVFSLFLAAYRDDLRDRFIRLAGERKVYLTSEMLNDVASKVSAYLWTQLLVNTLFGMSVALLFFVFDIEFALLWGALLGLLRFIPFVGIWIGGSMPLFFALATEPTWGKAFVVVATVLSIDFLVTQFFEPYIIGRRIGLSPVAVLLSAFVWTLVWGPAGLVIATPLTACLVVAGRYFGQFEFATILFSDEPALTPSLQLYHRALSQEDLKSDPWLAAFAATVGKKAFLHTAVLPALRLLARDRDRRKFSRRKFQHICSIFRSSLSVIHQSTEAIIEPERATVLLAPIDDEVEGIMATALAAFCDSTDIRWRVTSKPLSVSKLAQLAQATNSQVVVLCSLHNQPAVISRYCEAFAKQSPETRGFLYTEDSTATKGHVSSKFETISSPDALYEIVRENLAKQSTSKTIA